MVYLTGQRHGSDPLAKGGSGMPVQTSRWLFVPDRNRIESEVVSGHA